MIFGAILAGGVGKRIENHDIPKQFITVGGTPIIIITVREIIKNRRFDVVYIAVHHEWMDYMDRLLKSHFSSQERERMVVVKGGKERLDSFINIMDEIIGTYGLNREDILICHDAVRPFVRQQMIDDCIDATLEDGFALTVVPTTDTIHIAHDNKFIDSTLDRDGLFNGQTPSGFNVELLKKSLDSFSDEVKSKVTGTTQLILKLGYKLRIVKGHTSNFKITTDNDIDVAERILSVQKPERSIMLLDCTLRDGGIVLDFNFGIERMHKIKAVLENSGVDYIECGYINEKNGTSSERSCFDNEHSIQKTLLDTGKKENINYLAMIDYGTFDVQKLQNRVEGGIDGIRLAFHKENWHEAIEYGKIILSKGYDLFIQPMVTIRYSDNELCELIRVCNEELSLAKGFYIVDSFGQMDSSTLTHILKIADANVLPTMKLGFHAHNNRQLAFSNAKTFLEYNTQHDIILDSSIMGMGKGAGNLCTELIEETLQREDKVYNTTVIYDSISDYFSGQQKKTPWGYSLDYYLSSIYSCTPSYIKIFTADKRITTDMLIEMLKNIPNEKKAACDRTFAKEYMKQYLEGNDGNE